MLTTEDSISPLTIVIAHMAETEIDRSIDNGKRDDKELLIRDENGKVFKNLTSIPHTRYENSLETSELNLASNLSSSTELETALKHEKNSTQIEKTDIN